MGTWQALGVAMCWLALARAAAVARVHADLGTLAADDLRAGALLLQE